MAGILMMGMGKRTSKARKKAQPMYDDEDSDEAATEDEQLEFTWKEMVGGVCPTRSLLTRAHAHQ